MVTTRTTLATHASRGALLLVTVAASTLLVPASTAVGSPAASTAGSRQSGAARSEGGTHLYLVTLRGRGTGPAREGLGVLTGPLRQISAWSRQDDVLATLAAAEPVYRWTTALDGFAVRLDADQAALARELPEVTAVERDRVRPVTSLPDRLTTAGAATGLPGGPSGLPGGLPSGRGGAGVVVGVVDTGLAADSPVFAERRRPRGATARRYAGPCASGPGWAAAECNGKVAGARFFVAGFGADRLRAASRLSPLDTDGHGTLSASLAVGNSGLPVRLAGEPAGRFAGAAPQARVAVYKACWSAPDPRDDGCATSDLVTAVDRATADGVDVLSLGVGGPARVDTLERALLGATEAGVVAVAAAGNGSAVGGGRTAAAHPSPWVVSVGGTTGGERRGRVRLVGGPRLAGAMTSRQAVPPSRLVLGADASAAGVSPQRSRFCGPGTLDARRVAGALVVCERGRVGRVDKSRAVALADGVGMVLVNRGPGPVDADVHSVPTVQLDERAGRRLTRWLATHPAARAALEPRGVVRRPVRVARFSASGAPDGRLVAPDLVAPASGVVAAAPDGWQLASGTSTAGAHVAGLAARLLARGLRPAVVRSALVTTAAPVRGAALLRAGAGEVSERAARRPGLAYLVGPRDYRAWLAGHRRDLNTPSIALAPGVRGATRTITNVSGRRLYFSSRAVGFRGRVLVTPAAVRLGRGESESFRLQVLDRRTRLDDGFVEWRGATGTVTRSPVVIAP